MLHAKGINRIYKDGKRSLHVLKDIDLEIKKGEVLSVVGPSGAGKSTLLHIIGGIDRPNSGKVFWDGVDLYRLSDNEKARIRNHNIGFVFQFYHLLPEFTAMENVIMPMLVKGSGSRVQGSRIGGQVGIKDRVMGLLQELGLGERLHHRPSELSGGEQQRVAIARAVVTSPKILLCDEPTGNLDSKMGGEILESLWTLNRKDNMALVIVTHDKEISRKADRAIEMMDGRIK